MKTEDYKSNGMISTLARYVRDRAAAISVLFGLMAPLLIGVAGVSLDMSQAFMVKQRLGQALDAAALAAAASSTDEAEIRQRVQDFFNANYPPDEIGITMTPVVELVGDEVRVSASAEFNTMFLSIWGIDTIDVSADTTVVREVQGIEVVLVMDNTGSMGSNNNIQTLRDAASNFVYIMYGIDPEDGELADPGSLDGMATRDRDYIKVGLVPYATSVNVGPYGLGVDFEGDYYSAPFVNNPHDLSYNYSSSTNDWAGCVLAHDYPDDTIDHEGPWDMYRYCRDEDDEPYCDTTTKWDKKKKEYVTKARRAPNYNCTVAPIMPLSTSPSNLKVRIDSMIASGHTYGNYGMVWGYRVISPDYPFEEGVAWENEYWRKAVVMMTDGINTMHSNYSAYGPTRDHNIDAGDLNERFEDVCENLKEEGVIIYTVTFAGGVNENTKDYYRECATAEEYYHDAPSQEDLVDVFETISRELSNLHIKE